MSTAANHDSRQSKALSSLASAGRASARPAWCTGPACAASHSPAIQTAPPGSACPPRYLSLDAEVGHAHRRCDDAPKQLLNALNADADADAVHSHADASWQEAAAAAGLQEPQVLYSRAILVGLGGCNSTLHQHAHCCARILARRHTACQELDGPAATSLGPSLTRTAGPAQHHLCAAVRLTSRQLRDPGLVPLPVQHCSQIEELTFSPQEKHLAVAYREGVNNGMQRSLMLLEVDTWGLSASAPTSATGQLHVTWAPSGDLLAACGPHTVVVLSASGSELARRDGLSYSQRTTVAWRPDSSGLLACRDRGELLGMRVSDAKIVEHPQLVWEAQRLVFLPCCWYGRFWVAILLRSRSSQGRRRSLESRSSHHMAVDLRPGDLLEGGGAAFAGELLPVGGCYHMDASAQHVAVCCPGPGDGDGPGCIYVFAVVSRAQQLSLQPQRTILTQAEPGAHALSPCGLWLGFISAPEWLTRAWQISVVSLHSPQLRSDWPVQPGFALPHPCMQWSADSSRLAVTSSGQLWTGVADWRSKVFAFA